MDMECQLLGIPFEVCMAGNGSGAICRAGMTRI